MAHEAAATIVANLRAQRGFKSGKFTEGVVADIDAAYITEGLQVTFPAELDDDCFGTVLFNDKPCNVVIVPTKDGASAIPFYLSMLTRAFRDSSGNRRTATGDAALAFQAEKGNSFKDAVKNVLCGKTVEFKTQSKYMVTNRATGEDEERSVWEIVYVN